MGLKVCLDLVVKKMSLSLPGIEHWTFSL